MFRTPNKKFKTIQSPLSSIISFPAVETTTTETFKRSKKYLLTESSHNPSHVPTTRSNIFSRNGIVHRTMQSHHYKTLSSLSDYQKTIQPKSQKKKIRVNNINEVLLTKKDNASIHNVFKNGIPKKKIDVIYYQLKNPKKEKKFKNYDLAYLKHKKSLSLQFVSKNKNGYEIIENNFEPYEKQLDLDLGENKNYICRYINNALPCSKKEKQVNNQNILKCLTEKKTKKKSKCFKKSKKIFLGSIVQYSLPNEVKDKIEDIKQEEIIKVRKDKLKKWITIMVRCAIHFRHLDTDIKDFYSKNKNVTEPYKHEKAFELFLSIKRKDKTRFLNLIREDKSLVYDFDHFNQTILHWIAKKNLYDWISFAVKNGAVINALDYTGRTPLHVACSRGNLQSVMVFLYEMAYPFYKDNNRKAPIDLTTDYQIIYILKRSVVLYLINSMAKKKHFVENIKRGLKFLFVEELRTDFSIDRYCIYE